MINSGGKKDLQQLADKIEETNDLSDSEFASVLLCDDPEFDEYLSEKARNVREKYYGKDVYLRGLIEFTNYCRNNCYYCGIRNGNKNIERYRLSEEQILSCCSRGYELGFRTFVLQGGEDPYYSDGILVPLIREIKKRHPDCAVTLSVGEREKDSYQRLFDAGADRYLLRHETADRKHYEMLHPETMSYDHRIQCLENLKEIGYQVGCGMMVGSPGQSVVHIIEDLRFLQKIKPEMAGIGPFIPHHDTVFSGCKAGSANMTLRLLSVIRLMLPDVLLPATTALGTADAFGREKGIMAGANVVMPNLSPIDVRNKYLLYDNKICIGDDASACIRCISGRVSKTGYQVVVGRGDHTSFAAAGNI